MSPRPITDAVLRGSISSAFLKLDPDNQRAKDGFAEANARANPPEE